MLPELNFSPPESTNYSRLKRHSSLHEPRTNAWSTSSPLIGLNYVRSRPPVEVFGDESRQGETKTSFIVQPHLMERDQPIDGVFSIQAAGPETLCATTSSKDWQEIITVHRKYTSATKTREKKFITTNEGQIERFYSMLESQQQLRRNATPLGNLKRGLTRQPLSTTSILRRQPHTESSSNPNQERQHRCKVAFAVDPRYAAASVRHVLSAENLRNLYTSHAHAPPTRSTIKDHPALLFKFNSNNPTTETFPHEHKKTTFVRGGSTSSVVVKSSEPFLRTSRPETITSVGKERVRSFSNTKHPVNTSGTRASSTSARNEPISPIYDTATSKAASQGQFKSSSMSLFNFTPSRSTSSMGVRATTSSLDPNKPGTTSTPVLMPTERGKAGSSSVSLFEFTSRKRLFSTQTLQPVSARQPNELSENRIPALTQAAQEGMKLSSSSLLNFSGRRTPGLKSWQQSITLPKKLKNWRVTHQKSQSEGEHARISSFLIQKVCKTTRSASLSERPDATRAQKERGDTTRSASSLSSPLNKGYKPLRSTSLSAFRATTRTQEDPSLMSRTHLSEFWDVPEDLDLDQINETLVTVIKRPPEDWIYKAPDHKC